MTFQEEFDESLGCFLGTKPRSLPLSKQIAYDLLNTALQTNGFEWAWAQIEDEDKERMLKEMVAQAEKTLAS